MSVEIPNTNCIGLYLHCSKCLNELPDDVSPQDYARLAIGQTVIGLQVWCVRHNVNVCHIDFLGNKLPVNLTVQIEPITDNVVSVDFKKKQKLT